MVLFRDREGHAAALLDRCPHRNVPLSLGRRTKEGSLECPYHGWTFAGDGRCTGVPGLREGPLQSGAKPEAASGEAERSLKARDATSFPVREQDGFVWVCPSSDRPPLGEPFPVPTANDTRYGTVVRRVDVEGTLHATVENALDVPHTAYLHRGLFRGGDKNRVRAVVRRYADRIETEYLGEPKPPGVVAKILSPSGVGTVEHWDRFFLPSVAQVEYRLGDAHFLVTSLCTPVSDFHTRMFAVASFRTAVPARVVRAILEPFAMRIFRQDAKILRAQTENIRRFGGEQFASTEIDVMGPGIWRLMREAERREDAPDRGGETRESVDSNEPRAAEKPIVHEVELDV